MHIYLDALENFIALTYDTFLGNYITSGEASSSTMVELPWNRRGRPQSNNALSMVPGLVHVLNIVMVLDLCI